MKKVSLYRLALSLALIFITSTITFAQVVPKFGLKGGVNFSTFAQSDIDGYETKPGFMFGAFVELGVPFSPISFQPEIVYAQFGAGLEDLDASINVNYIQVPVLLKFNLEAPGVSPNLQFGPYANFLVNAEIDGDGGSVDIDEIINGSTFGIILGAGIDTDKIQIGLRVSAGLSEVFEDDFSDNEKNLGIGLTIGVKL